MTEVSAVQQGLLAAAALAAFCFGASMAGWLHEGGRRSQLSRRARRIAKQRLPGRRRLPWGLSWALRAGAGAYVAEGDSRSSGILAGRDRRFDELARKAGLGGELSGVALRRASMQLTIAGGVAGAALGLAFSVELALLMGVAGLVAGGSQCSRELRGLRLQRNGHLAKELPEMLEVMALGLRSGLAFDQAMALYVRHFDTSLGADCRRAMGLWSAGLASREEALSQLARGYDSPQLDRVARSIGRCLRLGTPLSAVLEEAAAEARAQHKAQLQERVAKAPVKMMVPTAAFMLPALLLLVIGPVLLQLME